jgi:hypothetical protein
MTGIEAGKTWSRIGAEVAPTSSAASGADTWPAPMAGSYTWVAGFNFSSASTSTVSFTSLPKSTYSEFTVRIMVSDVYINAPMVNINSRAFDTVNRHAMYSDNGTNYGVHGGSGSTIYPLIAEQQYSGTISALANIGSANSNIRHSVAVQAGAGWTQGAGSNVSITQVTGLTWNPAASTLTSIEVTDKNGRNFTAGTTINLFGIPIV